MAQPGGGSSGQAGICGLQVWRLTGCEGESRADERVVRDLLQACVPGAEAQTGMGSSWKG